MPVLSDSASLPGVAEGPVGFAGRSLPRQISGLLPVCSNPQCASGWLRLWRTRYAPVFEGGWLCGAACARTRMRAAVLREMEGMGGPPPIHRHRVPLGLALLSQGEISREQLRAALARQKTSGGLLGMWLEREHGINERAITRVIGAHWGAPVLTLDSHSPDKVAGLVPRLFLDAFAFLPLRTAGAALLYLGFADRIDRSASFAVERMSGLRVEAGVVAGRAFAAAHRRMLSATFPPARLVEAAGVDALVGVLTRAVEQTRPADARLVRMHDYFWLRMWRRLEGSKMPGKLTARVEGVEDVICSLTDIRA